MKMYSAYKEKTDRDLQEDIAINAYRNEIKP